MLQWGIIGTGEVAFEVASAIQYLAKNELRAVASRQQKKAVAFAKKFQTAQAYPDYEALINEEALDVVYIATPNATHEAFIRQCLEKGKHVLCEKPICLNTQQLLAVQALAAQRGLFCMEAMWTMFIPAIRQVLKMVQAGRIGSIKMIQGSFGNVFEQSRCFDPAMGGGVLLDLGVYLISLTYALLGEPETVGGQLVVGPSGVDEQASIHLHYADGALASLSCSYHCQLDNELTIFGTAGSLKVPAPFYRPSGIQILPPGPTQSAQKPASHKRSRYDSPIRYAPFLKNRLKTNWPFPSGQQSIPFIGSAYHYQIEEVQNCLNENRLHSSLLPLDHSLAVLRITDTLRQQAKLINSCE